MIYWPKYSFPTFYGQDVLTAPETIALDNGESRILYVTRAIVFSHGFGGSWKVLRSGTEEWHTPWRSMEEFVKDLKREFGEMAGKFVEIIEL